MEINDTIMEFQYITTPSQYHSFLKANKPGKMGGVCIISRGGVGRCGIRLIDEVNEV